MASGKVLCNPGSSVWCAAVTQLGMGMGERQLKRKGTYVSSRLIHVVVGKEPAYREASVHQIKSSLKRKKIEVCYVLVKRISGEVLGGEQGQIQSR